MSLFIITEHRLRLNAALLLPLMTGVLLAQTPAQPFPNHEMPPEGWTCHPALNQKEVETNPHACACRGMTMVDPDPEPFCTVHGEDENGAPATFPRGESSTCKVFCHKDRCTCAKRCETT